MDINVGLKLCQTVPPSCGRRECVAVRRATLKWWRLTACWTSVQSSQCWRSPLQVTTRPMWRPSEPSAPTSLKPAHQAGQDAPGSCSPSAQVTHHSTACDMWPLELMTLTWLWHDDCGFLWTTININKKSKWWITMMCPDTKDKENHFQSIPNYTKCKICVKAEFTELFFMKL